MKRIAIPIETHQLCHYGCGQTAKFKNGSGNLMCNDRSTKCPSVKDKNRKGVVSAYESGKTMGWSLLSNDDRIKGTKGRIVADFSYGGKGSHKKILITERGHVCECCGLKEWLGKPITLELEHIDGDSQNNMKTNLKLLCPNCHSQTDTWKGKNSVKKKQQKYVPSEVLLESLQKHKSIRAALLAVGLTGKGANYQRAYSLLNR